jgi:beta-lactamase class A
MKQNFSFEPRWFAVVIFFVAGVFMGAFVLFIWIFNGGRFYGIQKIHSANGSYKFINPLLAVDLNQPLSFFETDNAKSQINSLINQDQKAGRLQVAGLYFQELETGRWFGINEDNKFLAGKTLKVPIMIAYFKAAEANPAILKKILVYISQPDDSTGNNQVPLEDGQSYPVEDFIREMIIDDSSSAANSLFDNIDKNALNQVYSDLSIEFKEDKTSNDFISAKQNALFYRVLYNATYLNRQDSEKALEILSQSDIGLGAAQYLPKDVAVAHRHPPLQQTSQQSLQRGDCGIVYFPGHPYIFCAMISAKDQNYMENFLGKLGQIIYQDMAVRYKNNN